MGNLLNASDAVSNSEIKNLFEDKIAGVHNPLALNNAMVINLMFLGFRGSKELYTRMLGDIKIVTVDGNKELHIAKERTTKTRTGEVPKSVPYGLPILAATGGLDCPVKVFEELQKRRPRKFLHDNSPMFLRPATTDPKSTLRPDKTWFYNSRVGLNYIGKMMRTMMVESDVDVTGRKITNTSCQKSMATTMIKKNYSTKAVMRQLRHAHPDSMLRYDASDVPAEQITGDLFGQPPEQPCSSKDNPEEEQLAVAPSHFGPNVTTTKIFNIQF